MRRKRDPILGGTEARLADQNTTARAEAENREAKSQGKKKGGQTKKRLEARPQTLEGRDGSFGGFVDARRLQALERVMHRISGRRISNSGKESKKGGNNMGLGPGGQNKVKRGE